jgi:hypothetical protein
MAIVASPMKFETSVHGESLRARTHCKTINQQRLKPAASAVKVSIPGSDVLSGLT